jgi:hypothetical protein
VSETPTIVEIGRALEAVIQRVMGHHAEGKLFVRSLSGEQVLERGRFAIPIVNDAQLNEACVYVKRNPATYTPPANGLAGSGGDWTITEAGVLVDVETLQGGPQTNQVAGTLYRWDLPVPGIEEQSPAGTDIAGGTQLPQGIMQLRHLRELKTGAQEELFAGRVATYPAAILCWAGTTPSDGPMQSSPGPRTSRAASNAMLFRTKWFLFIASSVLTSSDQRVRQGLQLVSELLEILQDCQTARELRVSTAPGIEILDAGPHAANQRVYIDLIQFATHTALRRKPADETFSPWLALHHVNELGGHETEPPIKLPDQIAPIPEDGLEPGELERLPGRETDD